MFSSMKRGWIHRMLRTAPPGPFRSGRQGPGYFVPRVESLEPRCLLATITDLGTLPSASDSYAINNVGQVVGNWRAPASGHPNPLRNLTGRMDAFLLFNQALDAQEIQDLYQAGEPNS